MVVTTQVKIAMIVTIQMKIAIFSVDRSNHPSIDRRVGLHPWGGGDASARRLERGARRSVLTRGSGVPSPRPFFFTALIHTPASGAPPTSVTFASVSLPVLSSSCSSVSSTLSGTVPTC